MTQICVVQQARLTIAKETVVYLGSILGGEYKRLRLNLERPLCRQLHLSIQAHFTHRLEFRKRLSSKTHGALPTIQSLHLSLVDNKLKKHVLNGTVLRMSIHLSQS